MGWTYRKSASFGPFRINLSKSGIGYSIGGKGFRTGVNARGRRYTSLSVPGTGLQYRKSGKGATGCAVALVAVAGWFAVCLVVACTAWLG
ncbi:MAG TPA: DUF4236 domain-containing protein [Pirellulales bacterium]|nr:DUF4236 domain-containing protein [Pirellulales bacterium]